MPLDLDNATVEVIRANETGKVEILVGTPPSRQDGRSVAVTMSYDEARMLVRYIIRRLKTIEG